MQAAFSFLLFTAFFASSPLRTVERATGYSPFRSPQATVESPKGTTEGIRIVPGVV
jgi:hypothetical protein